jgi:hypothetical protein
MGGLDISVFAEKTAAGELSLDHSCTRSLFG